MNTNFKYVDTFRKTLVSKVIEQGLEVAKVARQSGISKSLLNSWVDDSLGSEQKTKQKLQVASRQIQKENWELRRQNDLLKKVIDHIMLLQKSH